MYLLLLVLLPDAGVLDGEDDEAIGILLVLQKTKIIETLIRNKLTKLIRESKTIEIVAKIIKLKWYFNEDFLCLFELLLLSRVELFSEHANHF